MHGEGKKRVLAVLLENLQNLFNYQDQGLLGALKRVASTFDAPVYLVGGTVRDYFLGRVFRDLDVAVPHMPRLWAERLRREFGGGAIIDLCGPEDESFRFVHKGRQVDISAFRGGSDTIMADLQLRDFTVNSMAVEAVRQKGDEKPVLIDPTGGFQDLQKKIVRALPAAFVNDPVRILRGFRLHACLGFTLLSETMEEIEKKAPLLARVAPERVQYELHEIFSSIRTHATLILMDQVGVLPVVLPELYSGRGVLQPEFHHLDVFHHNLTALQKMEQILAAPAKYFPGHGENIDLYLQTDGKIAGLKWAALLHDVGKPPTQGIKQEIGEDGIVDRVTFYRHDQVGKEIFQTFATRNRWSNSAVEFVGSLIERHMHPFHLCNVQRKGGLSKRAVLKLCRRVQGDLTGLFLLAMADSLASEGEKKPADMEVELQELYSQVCAMYAESIQPVLEGTPLVTGKDLIEVFGLDPGPIFSRILSALEIARIEGEVDDKDEAMKWLGNYLQDHGV